MKKLLLLSSLILTCASAFAQVEDANRVIIHAKDGTTHAFNFADLDYLNFDKVGDISLTAAVVSGSVSDTCVEILVTPSAECASYKVAYQAGTASPTDFGTFSGQKTVAVTGLAPSTDYSVTVTPLDKYNLSGTAVTLSVTTLAAGTITPSAPKVGDYFYSDGTWSDGGLISMDFTGRSAVWAENKPAPLAGKTVIGIVCSVDPSRIAEEDIADGYTHGYVLACKNATDPKKKNYEAYPETVWYGAMLTEIEHTKVAKIAKTCYDRVSGRADTQEMLKYYGDPKVEVPMFYYCTTAFPVEAPSNTSGWFVPSVGQVWDCIANFCGGKVAEALYEARTLSSDFTYFTTNTNEPVMENFMRVFSLVPAADKDEITMNDVTSKPTAVSLRTGTRYDTESAIHFNLGTDTEGLFEGMAGWFDEEGHARPMLAF